jgi:hypothetical protein
MTDIVERLRASLSYDTPARYPEMVTEAADEIERLREQCRGMANAALNNGQGLLIYERALEQIKALSYSEDGEPLDDAIQIAETALAFKAPELKFGR